MLEFQKSEFGFSNPCLMGFNFSINKGYQPKTGETEVDIPMRMNFVKPDIGSTQKNRMMALLTVDMGTQDDTTPYYISITMGATFSWKPSLSKEQVDTLLTQNAPALLLGYMRPHVAEITSMSPIGAVHIPFMTFTPKTDGE